MVGSDRTRRRLTLARALGLGLVGAIALVATGCGDGDETGGGPETASERGAGSTNGDAAAADAADASEDAPIEIGADVLALAREPNRDLSLIDPMVRLNAVHFGMGPFIRDRARYEQIAQAADAVVAICDEPAFAEYTSRPDFEREPERFEELYTLLRQGAVDAAAAARAGDAEALFDAYTRMDVSCTGCHKRYAPLQ